MKGSSGRYSLKCMAVKDSWSSITIPSNMNYADSTALSPSKTRKGKSNFALDNTYVRLLIVGVTASR